MMIVKGLYQEISNRVVRDFVMNKGKQDSLLVVKFRNDLEELDYYNQEVMYEILKDLIVARLRNGFWVGDK
jgi:hypothetical protein